MLGALGIYAMSPFIGTSDVKTSTNFITNSNVLVTMLQSNYPWIKYAVERLLP